jgi:hypothetical protein
MMSSLPVPHKRFCVYVYRDPRPGKSRQPFYVGKGNIKNGRAFKHLRFGSKNPLFARVLKKLKDAGMEPIIEIVEQFDDEEEAFSTERALIKEYGRRDLGTGNLANMTDGGDGNSEPSAEKRKRLAEAASSFFAGRPKTLEHRARIGAAHKGRKKSAEWIARNRVANKGRKHTAEAKANMSASLRGRPKSQEWKSKAKAWLHNPEIDARRAAGVRSPEARAKTSASLNAYWARRRAEEIECSENIQIG